MNIIVIMTSKLTDSLGGAAKLKNEYPLVYSLVKNTTVHKDTSGLFSASSDDVQDGYMNVEEVYGTENGIGVFVRCDFLAKKPVMIINIVIIDETTGLSIDSFTIHRKNVAYMEERFFSSTERAAVAAKHKLRVDATFLWSDDGNSGHEVNKSLTIQQYYNDIPIIKDVEVTAPRAKDEKLTIVLYDRTPFSGESPDYVYKKVLSNDRKTANLMMPFAGEISVNDDFRIDSVMMQPEVPELHIILEHGGDAEYKSPKGIVPQFIVDSTGSKISWSFDEDWKNQLDLTHFLAKTIVNLFCKFTLNITYKENPLVRLHPVIMISSTDGHLNKDGVEEIERISIRWGCVARDTPIAMTDGTEKKIQDVRPGDKVRTEHGGSVVKDIISGMEQEIIYLETDNSCKVKITGSHPVKTERGFVRGDELTAADIIITADGASRVRSLFEIPYGGEVYNLELEPTGAITCGGIIMGDFEMQNAPSQRIMQDCHNSNPLLQELDRLFASLHS